MTRQRKVLVLSALAASGLLLAVGALYKPLRVLAPETFGLKCLSDDICVEDTDTLAEATALRDNAINFVEANLGPLRETPRVLFCNSKDCFTRFGNPKPSALYVWGIGTIVINDRGWLNHIVRHEFIHHWQAENYGASQSLLHLPKWYIEGMAYSLSQDPRVPLPGAGFEEYRSQFDEWLASGNDWRIPPQ